MNWYHSARAVNELAGQYVLGTLQGRARRRFEAVMALRPEVAERVADWEARLHRMAGALSPVAPSAAVWETLARRAGVAASAAAVAVPVAAPGPAVVPAAVPMATPAVSLTPQRKQAVQPAASGLWQQVLRRLQALLTPLPAGALAFGLLLGSVLPQVYFRLQAPTADTELPESYVGVLATPAGKPGLIVASRRYSRVVDLKQVSPVTVPPGMTLFLWLIDAQGVASAVAPVPQGPFVQAGLADTAEIIFKRAVELGVTFETVGAAPTAPTGAWVYRGLCGKVWRVPPPSAAASR